VTRHPHQRAARCLRRPCRAGLAQPRREQPSSARSRSRQRGSATVPAVWQQPDEVLFRSLLASATDRLDRRARPRRVAAKDRRDAVGRPPLRRRSSNKAAAADCSRPRGLARRCRECRGDTHRIPDA
jgi:hypothetical protein